MKTFYLFGLFLAFLTLDTSVTKASDDDFEGFFGEMDSDKAKKKYAASSDDEDTESIDSTQQPETKTEGSCVIPLVRSGPSSLSSSLDIRVLTKKPSLPSTLLAYTYVPAPKQKNPFLEDVEYLSSSPSHGTLMSSSLPIQSVPDSGTVIYTRSKAIPIAGKSDQTEEQEIDEIQRSQEESKSHRLRSLSKNSVENF